MKEHLTCCAYPAGHIVTSCHCARQLWGVFLHARDQLHYNCMGWVQQSGEKRDLKGPRVRKEATVLPLKTGEKSDDQDLEDDPLFHVWDLMDLLLNI